MLNMQQQGSYHCHLAYAAQPVALDKVFKAVFLQPSLTCPLCSPLLSVHLHPQEHQVYPFAVSALVDQRITWRADGIPIIWSAH